MDAPQLPQNELLMFRSQEQECQNHIYIFNSPIDYQDQHLIVWQSPAAMNGDAGYCVVYKRDHFIINNPPNYQSPTKRSFLNECIRQLYLMYGLGHKLHWEPNTSLESRENIWQQVDVCLQPERVSPKRANVERVKRQLFRADKDTRKNRKPGRGKTWGTQVFFFKPMRQKIGRGHGYIRRDYFRCARHNVLQELIYEKLKRQVLCSPAICNGTMGNGDGIFNANASVISDICNYHSNSARHQPAVEKRLTPSEANVRNNEACRLTERAKRLEAMFIHEQVRRATQNHQLILEESVRSVFYAKQLFRLIEDHEEFVYTDNQILTRR